MIKCSFNIHLRFREFGTFDKSNFCEFMYFTNIYKTCWVFAEIFLSQKVDIWWKSTTTNVFHAAVMAIENPNQHS